MITVSQRGAPMAGADAANGWPVSSTTSSARTMRRPSVGRIDAAAAGSRSAELGVQGAGADLGEPLLPLRPHRGIGRRERPVVEQRLDVEHRTADDDRHRAARGDRLDVGGGGLLVARHGRGRGDVEDVELVVRDAATLRDGKFRGADVHAAVELHRVGVDDLRFRRRAAPQRQGPVRFAGAGRPDDRERPHSCQTPAK